MHIPVGADNRRVGLVQQAPQPVTRIAYRCRSSANLRLPHCAAVGGVLAGADGGNRVVGQADKDGASSVRRCAIRSNAEVRVAEIVGTPPGRQAGGARSGGNNLQHKRRGRIRRGTPLFEVSQPASIAIHLPVRADNRCAGPGAQALQIRAGVVKLPSVYSGRGFPDYAGVRRVLPGADAGNRVVVGQPGDGSAYPVAHCAGLVKAEIPVAITVALPLGRQVGRIGGDDVQQERRFRIRRRTSSLNPG